MFGKWKWLAAVVAYGPLLGFLAMLYGIYKAFSGMAMSGSAGIGAVAEGIAYCIWAPVLVIPVRAAGIIWFTMLFFRHPNINRDRATLMCVLGILFGEFALPVSFHMLCQSPRPVEP